MRSRTTGYSRTESAQPQCRVRGPAALMLVLCAVTASAADTYAPSTRQLTIPVLSIGAATFSNVVVTVGNIVAGPAGSAPNGSGDSYDPSKGLLTVQAVQVGGQTYFNAVVTVSGLVSIGSVAGADSFNGTYLTIPAVQVGAQRYANVTLAAAVANVVSVGNGLPQAALDQYDPGTGHLTVAAIQVGSTVYTNVVLTATLSDVVAAGPAVSITQVQNDIFTPLCSDCHNPGGPVPNLSTASASASTSVNVPSDEQPSIPFVKPRDPNGSYLFQKLTGADSISGRQMPKGGPYLTQAQLDEIGAWIMGL